ncbi:MAG: preprotein translocase subunit YajC [Candidatus Omnitrophica bacterium]|nr:preprotein translocase subunit YajC [Candidatus Omnitrophota bacterium]
MLYAYAEAPSIAPQTGAGLFQFFIMMAAIMLIWHFLVLRPQKKQQEDHKKLIASLGKNDEVITSGGIHGTIVNVKEHSFVLKIDDNAKMEIQKDHVTTVKKKREKAMEETK